jgi:polysaccharide export outer membrane protein
VVVGVALFCLLGNAGCHHSHHDMGPAELGSPIAVPPPGAVPRELELITLPPYVIGAPDQLLIEVVQRSEIDDPNAPNPDKPRKIKVTDRLPIQPISGPFQVRPDGTVGLGYWGSVPVAGLTLEHASEAVRKVVIQNQALKEFETKPESIIVIMDVLAYNSKRYYVIFDGAGFGESVIPFPITGSDTVLDAISNVNGLTDAASKRNIWVARRTPHPGQPWQILPVDWVGISQHGITTTNYQIMPGDRIYVKAQKLVTIDRTLARLLAPIERIMGVTLLGATTVNAVQGRNTFNNGN